ncbi:MAG: energy-coupling factor transporter transmembrane protein EcfT [Treponema sp.]|jgi:biotin transport system permease protein|nr:energy-coupling factor transporter transmembrane protein EcfT [Treponema sp.]
MAVKSKSTPWSYKKGTSPLHRLGAGIKLVFLLLLSVLAFIQLPFLPGFIIPGSIALILVLLSLFAGIGPCTLLRGSGPIFFVILAVFAFQAIEISPLGVNQDGLWESIFFCFRIGTAFAAGALLFSVTTPGEIRKSLSRLESFLRLKKMNISLCISLMLGFIPMLFQIWEDTNLAWKSRGGKMNLTRIVILVPLLVERMMVKAAEKAEAMEARGAGLD